LHNFRDYFAFGFRCFFVYLNSFFFYFTFIRNAERFHDGPTTTQNLWCFLGETEARNAL